MSIFFDDFYRLLSFKNHNFFPLKRFFFTKPYLLTVKIIFKTQKFPQKLSIQVRQHWFELRTSLNFQNPIRKLVFELELSSDPCLIYIHVWDVLFDVLRRSVRSFDSIPHTRLCIAHYWVKLTKWDKKEAENISASKIIQSAAIIMKLHTALFTVALWSGAAMGERNNK